MLTEHAAQTGVFYCFCLNQTQSFASEPFFLNVLEGRTFSFIQVSVVDKKFTFPMQKTLHALDAHFQQG